MPAPSRSPGNPTYPGRMAGHRIYKLAFSDLYPNYTHKAERKGRTKAEVDEVILWLTGYSRAQLDELITEATR